MVTRLPALSVTQLTSAGIAREEKNGPVTVESIGIGPIYPVSASASSIYVHVPFCFHKCHYCDFYSIVDNRDRQRQFVQRLITELDCVADSLKVPLETIFVGGGTPTLLAVEHWERFLAAVNGRVPLVSRGSEFTVEANPETVTPELMEVLARGGVNRISIGAQSFNLRNLKALERWHDPVNVARSIEIIRAAGIDNINLDLIFAIPGETLDDWAADLDAALALEPNHLSCYGLMYEPNTPLTKRMKAGQIMRVDEDIEAAMYECAIERLAEAGFAHYEVSNWALPNRCCQHNLVYWRNRPWWPLGPSASGHVNGWRWKNVPRLGEYLAHGPLPHIMDIERLDEDGRAGEELMLGLRLLNGMPLDRIEALLATGQRGAGRRSAIERHVASGLLERVAGSLRLTRRGLLLADSVLCDLI